MKDLTQLCSTLAMNDNLGQVFFPDYNLPFD
jgi:hypothetical protein